MQKLKLYDIIKYGALVSFLLAFLMITTVFLEYSFHHLTIKSFLFFGFSSFIFTLMYLLISYCSTCPLQLQKRLLWVGLTIIALGAIIWFNLFNTSKYWNILIGIAVLYLCAIEVQLLGWSINKQKILIKFILLLALLSNLFVAFILFFKVPLLVLNPFIISSCIISIFVLFFGLYLYPTKKTS